MLRVLALLLAGCASASVHAAAELVMYTAEHCAGCIQFEREVGDRYDRTDAAFVLPLMRRSFDPRDAVPAPGSKPVRGTPTFVVLCKGREVDRIVGYSNDELFWMRVAAIRERMPASCR